MSMPNHLTKGQDNGIKNNINKSILIVEDDKVISLALKRQFEAKGYVVHQAFTADVVERIVIRHLPTCILLDIKLPKSSGFDVFEQLQPHYQGPIVFLTADETPEIEIKGIGMGAAEFILKNRPFEVIYSRIERLLNNQVDAKSKVNFSIGDFTFNKREHICQYKHQVIELTQHEYELLYFFLIHKNTLLSRDHIYKSLKGIEYDGVSRGIDLTISRIKKKLTTAGLNKNVIITVRSKGYKLQSKYLN